MTDSIDYRLLALRAIGDIDKLPKEQRNQARRVIRQFLRLGLSLEAAIIHTSTMVFLNPEDD